MNRQNSVSEVAVYLCKNSMPDVGKFPVQWTEAGVHVRVKLVPCSGKIDIQYMLHALETGMDGVFVITCPHGECTLTQGNYRADIRVHTLQKLLEEIGLDTGCAAIVQCESGTSVERLKEVVNTMIGKLSTAVSVEN
jgi:coenzyme F420-reducing hydrogenase delta subunit